MRLILLLTALLLMSDCPVVSIMQPSTACVGQPLTFTANITGGTAPFHYTWNSCIIGDTIDIDTSVEHSVIIPSAEVYTVSVTITDAAGCVVWASATPLTTKDCN